MQSKKIKVVQILPALASGGVERGTLEVGRYLACLGHQSFVISAGGRMVQQLEDEGSQHIALPIGEKSLLTLRLIPTLIRLFKKHEIDIVHVRSRLPAWICKLALAFMPKAQRPTLITTVHGQYSVSAYSRVMTQGDAVIVISKAIEAYVLTNYPKPRRLLHLNYRGIDPAQFPYQYQPSKAWLQQWQRDYPHLKGKFIITLPARLTRWKGQEDVCHILATLKEEIPNIHGLIVGEIKRDKNNFFNELKNRIKKQSLESHLTFTDYRSDVREIMAISDIVLSLSHEPEAFGRTPIEALAMGVPVIGYAHGGVAEQLEVVFPQGRVKPKNYLEAARRIKEFHAEMPIVERTTAFRLQTMLENTLSIYQSTLASEKGSVLK